MTSPTSETSKDQKQDPKVAPPAAKAPAPAAKAAAPAAKPGPKPGPKPAAKAGPAAKSKEAPDRAKVVAAARAAILKSTGLKPIAESKAPLPAVSTGSAGLDDLIGGTPAADKSGPKCPGYPRRHITEIFGAESSGKTTAALEAIAEAQKNGGVAMFIDFEHALDTQYASKIGVSFDESRLMNYRPQTMEEGWRLIYIGIAAGVDIIVVDSVAAMVPNNELNNKKPGEAPKIGAVAAGMAQMLPKVCAWLDGPIAKNPQGTALIMLNQIRATISTGGGGGKGTNENTSGGYALKFFAFLRLKFSRTGSEIVKKKNRFTGKEQSYAYGNHTRVKIVKSKVDGKQGFTTDIFIRFNHGIDDFYSMIEAGVTTGIVSKNKATYEYDGQSFNGRDKFRTFLVDNPKVFAGLRTKVLAMVRNEEDIKESDLDDDDAILVSMEAAFESALTEGEDTTPEELEVEADDAETNEESGEEESGEE